MTHFVNPGEVDGDLVAHLVEVTGGGVEGKRNRVLKAGSADPRFKSMLGSAFNLAWKAIGENAFLRADPKLSEFFMSLSGTILSKQNEEGHHTLSTKTSLADTFLFSAFSLFCPQLQSAHL